MYFWLFFVLQGKMVLQLSKEPSARLLKHVVRCYLRLSDNSRYFFHTFSLLWENRCCPNVAVWQRLESCLCCWIISVKSRSEIICCVSQGERSSASVPAGPAEGHHVCSSAKGRLHHQTLARTTRQKPTGRSGHRPPRHPLTASVTHSSQTLHDGQQHIRLFHIQGHFIFFAKKLRNGAQHSRFVSRYKLTLDSAGLRKSLSHPLLGLCFLTESRGIERLFCLYFSSQKCVILNAVNKPCSCHWKCPEKFPSAVLPFWS